MSGSVVRVAALADLHCTKSSQGAFQTLFSRVSEAAEVLVIGGDLTDTGPVFDVEVTIWFTLLERMHE